LPRRIKVPFRGNETFGERLARLRKAAGYSMQDLATEIDVSKRMIAYYEKETDQPPAALLPLIAEALNVSADELLGIKTSRANSKPTDSRLWRRFKRVEKLPAPRRRQVLQFIDTVLESEQLKKKVSAKPS
jgi:transcriptional regulator with XRE-family HTH domain